MSEEEEVAKAVQEAAKLGQAVAPVANDCGRYLAGVIGEIPHSLLGVLLGDWLTELRIRRVVKMRARTLELAKEVGVQLDPAALPGRIQIEVVRGVSEEEDEVVQDIWARLVLNGSRCDDKRVLVNRAITGVLKQMECYDALCLGNLPEIHESFRRVGRQWMRLTLVSHFNKLTGGRDNLGEITLNNLVRLGCLEESVHFENIDVNDMVSKYAKVFTRSVDPLDIQPSIEGMALSQLNIIDVVRLTALGAAVIEATKAPT